MSTIVSITPYFPKAKLTFSSYNIKTFAAKSRDLTLASFLNPDVFSTFTSTDTKAILVIFSDCELLKEKSEYAADLAKTFKQPVFACSWNSILISAAMMACSDEFGDGIIEDRMGFLFCGFNDELIYFNVIKRENDYLINSITDETRTFFFRISQKLVASKICIIGASVTLTSPITEKQKEVQKVAALTLPGQNITPLTLTKNLHNYIGKAVVAKGLKMVQGKEFKFDVANNGLYYLGVGTPEAAEFIKTKQRSLEEIMRKMLINIVQSDAIPIKKTFVNFEKFENLCLFAQAFRKPGYSAPELGLAITLSVNQYFAPELDIKPLSTLPCGTKAVDNVAMICINNETMTVATINNAKFDKIVLVNMPLVISFVDEKTQIGAEAAKLKETHPTFIITDLLKLLKTHPSNLVSDPKWGFEISRHNNDEIGIGFDTFKGHRKETLPFVFAFFIEFAIKKVEEMTEKIPKTIVIVAKDLDDYFSKNLMDSCKATKFNLHNVQIHEHKIVEFDQ